jgi:hypothetical protein
VIYYSSLAAAGNVTPVVTIPQASQGQEKRLFKRVAMSLEELRLSRIEEVVSKHVGQRVSLDDNARLSKLEQLDRYEEHVSRHRSNRNFGTAIRSFFQRLKPDGVAVASDS